MVFSVTHLTVLVKYKSIFKKNACINLVWPIQQYQYKCSVHILYISAPQLKALRIKAHSYPNSQGGRNTAASPDKE